jgi:DNA excision repair protein ERCC-4
MPPPLRITVDDRERASPVRAWLEREPDVILTTERLDAGDYLAENLAVFERKTVGDFARSIVDGRLFRQAARLASCRLPAVIILEGAWRDAAADGGVDRRAMQGAIISLTTVFRLPLLRAADARETAALICYTAGQLRRAVGGAPPRPGYRPKGRRRRQLYILQGLPGVGPGRAARLLDGFGSVEKVVTAPADALAKVRGIGPRTARAIRAMVEEPGVTYVAASTPTMEPAP